jgi:hypothetical protein
MKVENPFWKIMITLGILGTVLLKSLTSYCQPTPQYTFTSPVLVSGTLNAVGSVYRFSTVKTGTDALVTIVSAVNASVAMLDQTAGGGGGYDAALQPNITVTKLTTGYVDFKIDFVLTGTSTPAIQSGVNVTALDIDGYNYAANQKLYEFEEFDLGTGSGAYYYFDGIDLSLSYLGSAIRGTNIRGVEYGGINSSQNVRFTMYKPSLSTLTVRSGAINGDQFNNVTRQRSFYFARYSYSNEGVLANSNLVDFSGTIKEDVTQLNFELTSDHKLAKVEIERSADNQLFKKIAGINTSGEKYFSFNDETITSGSNYYRLKLYDQNGNYTYSKILRIVTDRFNQPSFKIYPSVITGPATLSVTSAHSYKGLFSIVDARGSVLLNKPMNVQEGVTITDLPEVSGFKPGNYIVVLNDGAKKMTQQIIVARH